MKIKSQTKFILEINTWGDWQEEDIFSTLDQANIWGQQNFDQNEWRIVDQHGGVIYMYDPAPALAREAEAEIKRFQSTNKWRDRFFESKQRRIENAERNRQIQQQPRGEYVAPEADPDFFRALMNMSDDIHRNKTIIVVNWLKEGF